MPDSAPKPPEGAAHPFREQLDAVRKALDAAEVPVRPKGATMTACGRFIVRIDDDGYEWAVRTPGSAEPKE